MVKNIDLAINIIKNDILDDIVEKINKLHIDDETMEIVVNAVLSEKKDTTTTTKRKIPTTTRPKKEIPLDRQCTRTAKNGTKCCGIRTNNITKSCWSHMTPAEKAEHTDSKKNEPSTSKGKMKYTLEREKEDEADE
jgi:hypothetical protein